MPQQTSIGPAFDPLFFGLPVTKKITLTIELAVGGPIPLLLYDQSIGLPSGLVKIPRPANVIPEQGRGSNLTVMGKPTSSEQVNVLMSNIVIQTSVIL